MVVHACFIKPRCALQFINRACLVSVSLLNRVTVFNFHSSSNASREGRRSGGGAERGEGDSARASPIGRSCVPLVRVWFFSTRKKGKCHPRDLALFCSDNTFK